MSATRLLSSFFFLTLPLAVSAGEEFLTKDEFNKFLQEYRKNETENAKLRAQNAQLKQQVETLEATQTKITLESKLDDMANDPISKLNKPEATVRSGTTKFLLSGWADAGYEDRRGRNPTFTSSFHPVFLWKIDDRLSFESDLTYSVISYHFDDLATLQAGKFLTPFGAFIRRQHQTWSNKLPDDPLALNINSGLVPSYTVGVDIGGGFEACDTRFNYSAYVGNGPRLSQNNPTTFGQLDFNNDIDQNKNKAYGARFGWLPLDDLEIGASAQYSRVGDHHTPNSKVDGWLAGVDLSYTKDSRCLRGTFDLKAEWVWSHVDDGHYDFAGTDFFFHNDHRNGGYVQAAFRPDQLKQKWLKNLEFVIRYDRLDNPGTAPRVQGFDFRNSQDHDRGTIGLNYWLAPRAVLKFAYEKDRGIDRAVLFQFALGF